MIAPLQDPGAGGTLAGAEAPRANARQVAGEIVLVILPFLAALVINRFASFFYVGPIAVVAGVAIATTLLHRKGRRWHDLGFRRPRSWVKTIFGALGLYVLLGATNAFAVMPLLDALHLGRPDLGRMLVVRQNLVVYLVFVGPLAWGTAAFGEELIARGFILDRLADALGGSRAAWILGAVGQGVIFGLAHWFQGPAGMVTVTVIGVLFGWAYLRAGRNLWVTIITHGLVDTVSLTAIYFGVGPMQ